MNLAHHYATLIKQTPDTAFTKKLVAYMEAKGHLSLLPEIVRILEREPEKSAAVATVAKEHDAKKFAHEIQNALKLLGVPAHAGVHEKPESLIDEKLVGGYTVRAGSRIIDNSYRSALVTLYKNTIRN